MRKWGVFLCLAALLAGAVGLALGSRTRRAEQSFRRQVEERTGFRLESCTVRFLLWPPETLIRDLRLINPPDFPEPGFLHVRELRARWNIRSLFTGDPRIDKLVIDIPTAAVVVKDDGTMNIRQLQDNVQAHRAPASELPVETKPAGEESPSRPETAAEASGTVREPRRELRDIPIRELTLKLGTAEIRRYRGGQLVEPVETIPLSSEQTYSDIQGIDGVAGCLGADLIRAAGTHAVGEINRLLEQNNGDIGKTARQLRDRVRQLFGDGQ